jgi:hypothetical protein
MVVAEMNSDTHDLIERAGGIRLETVDLHHYKYGSMPASPVTVRGPLLESSPILGRDVGRRE